MNLKIFINGKRYPLGKRYFLVIGNDKTKPKYLLAMKLTMFFLLSFSSLIHAKAFAQISITVNNAPLEQVLKEIRKQSGYGFILNSRELTKARPTSVNLKDVTLEFALKEIFKNQPFSYVVGDRSIIIRLKQSSSFDSSTERNVSNERQDVVRGVVQDSLGNPIENVTVRIKGTSRAVITSQDGSYVISGVPNEGILQFSMLGYKSYETGATGNVANVILVETLGDLAAAEVTVNTGYQSIPKERATGSFVVLDSASVQRAVSTDFVERLRGMVPGMLSLKNSFHDNERAMTTNPLSRNTGIRVRGISTLSNDVSKDPLIVLDNFPYEGDLRNINPNDIDNITVLKDAAAASIWGARSGNGVIVITTKKGRHSQPLQIDFNTNLAIQDKPDIFYDPNFLSSSDYIDIENLLFNEGYFNSDINNTRTRPVISPVVDLLNKIRLSNNENEQESYQTELNRLRSLDIRNDFDKYVYQKSAKQQYYLGLRGGSEKLTHTVSFGFDRNRNGIIHNGFDRISVNTQNTYTPIKRLQITVGINYSNSKLDNDNKYGYGMNLTGGKYGTLPYTEFADEDGMPLAIPKDYRSDYLEQMRLAGFKDWSYQPLQEISYGDDKTKMRDLIIRTGIKYTFNSFLGAEILYQNENQHTSSWQFQSEDTYFVRNLVNRFASIDEQGNHIYNFPEQGGVLELGEFNLTSNNIRGQLYFNQVIKSDHSLNSIIGAEVRELKTNGFTRTSFGYDPQFGTAATALNFVDRFPVNPSGTALLPKISGDVTGITNRYISYYGNIAYSFQERYTLTLSGRRDGANLFGVNTNDKITPLWSAGLAWELSKERFYTLKNINYVRLRMTYGYNGNVYHGTAYLTGKYSTSTLTGLPRINPYDMTAPNPELSWERIRNINLGLDFGIANDRLTGSLEFYRKDGKNLVQPIELPPSTGFNTFYGNAAETRSNGIDLMITSRNLDKSFRWNTTFLFSLLKDKIISYDVPQFAGAIHTSAATGVEGKPLNAIFSYKWAGLDPKNGDPMGFVNGIPSKDYIGIINNYFPDSLVYSGSLVPTIFGSLRNDFHYRRFGLSFNIIYKLGNVFRRPTMSINYTDLLNGFGNGDFSQRWQKQGDELTTQIPSALYPNDLNRDNFYRYSEQLIESGSHIRLQDIRLSYDLATGNTKLFKALQFYAYASNVGILWKANKYDLDPDAVPATGAHVFPNPFSVAMGIRANF